MNVQFTLNDRTIEEHGRPVATVMLTGADGGVDSDTGVRLVGLLNLANRDEALLDQLAQTISTRNDG